MSQGDQDKTEQPTPYRLEEARRKGEVAKSADLVGVAGLLVFVVTLMLTIGGIAHALSSATGRVIGLAGARPLLGMEMAGWLGQVYRRAGRDSCKKQPFAFLALDVAVLLLLSLVLC